MKVCYLIVSDSFDKNKSIIEKPLEEELEDLLQVLEMIDEEETVFYMNDLFHQNIDENVTFSQWLFNSSSRHDSRRLMQIKFRGMKELEPSDYQQKMLSIENKIYEHPVVMLPFYKWTNIKIEGVLIVNNQLDYLKANRFYLSLTNDLTLFIKNSNKCFPQLYINDSVQQRMKKLKPFRNYIGEIIIHLSVLNDYGHKVFNEFRSQSENTVLRHLGIIGDIHCSPQGDPAYEKANLTFEFPKDDGGTVEIICAPHTKLFKKHSGERIYFHWGHPEVSEGKKLLVGHIGEHL